MEREIVMNKKLVNQMGSSMIEMLGVLSVAGMLGYGVLKIIGTVHNLFIQNMIVSEAHDLQKKISERYSFEGVYDTTLFSGRTCEGEDEVAEYICQQKLAPTQMCSNKKLRHRGGGDVKICQSEDGNDKYVMTFYGLPKTACVSLVQSDWYTRKKSYIYSMVVNGENGTTIYSNYIPGNHGDNVFPVSAAKAMAICNNEDDNTVQMTFF